MSYTPKLKPYNKKLSYSYSFGSYPTLMAFKYRSESMLKVIFHDRAEKSDAAQEILDICESNSIPYEINNRAVEKIAHKDNTYLIGIFEKYIEKIVEKENHIVLVNPRDMGNLGTIIRTMVGLGIYNLAIIAPASDIYDPKVIRSAMGAFFQVKFEYFETINDYLRKFPDQNYYPFMLDGADALDTVKIEKPYSLIFGNEGEGLDKAYKGVGSPIFIPQVGDIDSFNLSVSAAIGMWKATR